MRKKIALVGAGNIGGTLSTFNRIKRIRRYCTYLMWRMECLKVKALDLNSIINY